MPTSSPRFPFPQHAAYLPGTIRPSHRTQEQLDADLLEYYAAWKAHYLREVPRSGQPSDYRIAFSEAADAVTVSEGQGYGMVILPLLAGADPEARVVFDGLYRYSRAHPSTVDARLMDWRVPVDEQPQPGDDDSAFDGDSDIALGLLLAHAQWGSAEEPGYLAAAQEVIAGIRASTIGVDSRFPLLGDWVRNPEGQRFNQWSTRTSDFMPVNFRAFGYFTGDAGFWAEVVSACLRCTRLLQDGPGKLSGLVPDFVERGPGGGPVPARAKFLEGKWDGNYYYNACRVPWRLGTDALLHGDPRSLRASRKLAGWAATGTHGKPRKLASGYHLNGSPLPESRYFSSAFVGPLGVAAMTDPTLQEWLNRLYDAVLSSREDYYEDTLALQTLLVMTGNYWSPIRMAMPAPAM